MFIQIGGNMVKFCDIPRSITVFILLSSAFVLDGCGKAELTESTKAATVGNILPESDYLEAVRSFYSDALGVELAEVRPRLLSTVRSRIRLYDAYHIDGSRTTVQVDEETGHIKEYRDSSGLEEYEEGVMQEFYPEEYRKRAEYKKEMVRERTAEISRSDEVSWVNRDSQQGAVSLNDDPRRGDFVYEESGTGGERGQSVEVRERRRNEGRSVEQEWATLLEWKPEYERFSKAKAFERLKQLLEYLDQPLTMENYFVTEDDSGSELKEWRFRRSLEYEGVPYQGRYLSIDISCYSGRISRVRYEPVVHIPKPVASAIDKKEALKTAEKSMHRNEMYKWSFFERAREWEVEYDVDLEEIVKSIALPETDSGMPQEEKGAIEQLPPTESRYCWRVPFSYRLTRLNGEEIPKHNRMTFVRFIYVDMENGNVVCAHSELPEDTLRAEQMGAGSY